MSNFGSKLKGLYLVTDPVLLPGEQLFTGVEQALRGGAGIIQYRNKLANYTQQLDEAKILRSLTKDYQALLIINDHVQLCLDSEADGVHLGRSDGDIVAARKQLGTERILGVTCHNDIPYARESRILGADYCAFGRIFASHTKPQAPACSLDTLISACKESFPVAAIGGICHDNAQKVIDAGAEMLAVIHGVFGQTDIEQAARSLSQLYT